MPEKVPSSPLKTQIEAQPTKLETGFAAWEQRLSRLEADMAQNPDTNEYPQWWMDEDTTPISGIPADLKEDGADLNGVGRFFSLLSKESELRSTLEGHEPYVRPLSQTIYTLGEDLVGRAIAAEPKDGILHTAMLSDIEQLSDSGADIITPELESLKVAYGLDSLTDLLGVGGDDYDDKLRGLLRRPYSIKWIRYTDNKFVSGQEWAETKASTREWMSKAVEAATGMPAAEASNYVYTASRRNDLEDLKLPDILAKIEHFGIDGIRRISEFSGIHGLEGYSVDQLERVAQLASNPEEVAKNLANHDVNLVLINRAGDHNGVLEPVASDFDDAAQRSLFFEINDMSDIYKYASLLHKIGIRPSTLVLSAHSSPGKFIVADDREVGHQKIDIAAISGRKLVEMAMLEEGRDPGAQVYSMHGMKGFARLVEDYMQPSRGIDDNDSDLGRKKIIFQACHAASEVEMRDADDEGEKIVMDLGSELESVIGQLGSDLIASKIKSEVDIYGADEGIQMHATDKGVRYSSKPTNEYDPLGGITRPHLEATRVRVENGKLTKSKVHDIALRK